VKRTLAVISAGGVLGALARYGLTVAFPPVPGHFPWTTFGINVTGCLLIGVLMVLVTDLWAGRRLLRPFLGVGVLGGYTTFSTYAVDIRGLVQNGAPLVAAVYLVGTVVAAICAVFAGVAATRWTIRRRRERR
jgi:fluoride exporter